MRVKGMGSVLGCVERFGGCGESEGKYAKVWREVRSGARRCFGVRGKSKEMRRKWGLWGSVGEGVAKVCWVWGR